jgi:hypothetical protein
MIEAKTRVMPLATLTGRLLLNKPYNNQSRVPVVKTVYMEREIPSVFRVFMVLKAWGRKEIVVQKAAASPNMVTASIFGFECKLIEFE